MEIQELGLLKRQAIPNLVTGQLRVPRQKLLSESENNIL